MDINDENEFLTLAFERDPSLLHSKLSNKQFNKRPILVPDSFVGAYSKLRNHLILIRAAEIIGAKLGRRCVIATARSRTGLKKNLLYPMATMPIGLSSYFLEPGNYKGFKFDIDSLGSDRSGFPSEKDGPWQCKTYDLNSIDPSVSPVSGRIFNFLKAIANEPIKYGLESKDVQELKDQGICVVFGCRETQGEDPAVGSSEADEKFIHFGALYFLPELNRHQQKETPEVTAPDSICLQTIAEMYRALIHSGDDDQEGFERDALGVVSELIPALSDRFVAPSDVIAHFLNRMKDILKTHTVGMDNRHTWMRFISVNTVINNQEKECTPRFHIFPHVHVSKEDAVASFLLAHPGRLATIKVIMHLWAQNRGLPLSDSFESLFTHLDLSNYKVGEGDDYVCISEDDDDDLWGTINIDVSDNQQKTRCTLGFVLEKEFEGAKLPFAILVFESDIPDAFSEDDVKRFRSVVQACSVIFSDLQISKTSFDISWGIREAYAERSTRWPIGNLNEHNKPEGESVPFGQFLFELLRIDKWVLEYLIKSDGQKIWIEDQREGNERVGLSPAIAHKHILEALEGLKGISDHEAPDQGGGDVNHFNKILAERNSWIAENEDKLYDRWKTCGYAKDIYDFLTYVPSNIVWHCYLNAIPRAIADRAGGNGPAPFDANSAPIFKNMQLHGGLSAMAIFVFGKGQAEFRQIIKLNSRDKIETEAKNYRDYVRYMIPLSARLPYSGIAFEGDGSNSTEQSISSGYHIRRSTNSSGVLVSDLIAGEVGAPIGGDGKGPESRDRPVTLLMKAADLVMYPQEVSSSNGSSMPVEPQKPIRDFEEALVYQFEHNTKRWKQARSMENWATSNNTKNVTDAIRLITRVSASNGTNTIETLRVWLESEKTHDLRLQHFLNKLFGEKIEVEDLIGKVANSDKNGIRNLTVSDAQSMTSIIHGDLNSRNLVWSEDYLKFFMIDFEKVGLGFDGSDEMRLAFSLLADLADEAYQREDTDSDDPMDVVEIQERKHEMDKIHEDIDRGLDLLNKTISRLKKRPGNRFDQNSLSACKGVCDRAIANMINERILVSATHSFWAYVAKMSAAKQFEYALRGMDPSMSGLLERLVSAKELGDGDNPFNLYNYYSNAELMDRKHDKFKFGKTSRLVYAYQTLVKIMN